MSWADKYIEELKAGKEVSFRPQGNSMVGRISSGQLVTCVPVEERVIKVDDIVLCKVMGTQYLHLVLEVTSEVYPMCYRIGNNRGKVNGWTSTVYGIVVDVKD